MFFRFIETNCFYVFYDKNTCASALVSTLNMIGSWKNFFYEKNGLLYIYYLPNQNEIWHMLWICLKKLKLLAVHTVILPDWTLQKRVLVLPSSVDMNSSAPNAKEFFRSTEGFSRAALTGHGLPGPHWKIAKMALFNPCMEFQIFLGQMSSFDALWKCHLVIFSQKCPKLRPCAF